MNTLLSTNNYDLLREIEISKDHIASQPIPVELQPYKDWLLRVFENLERQVGDNFHWLSLNDDDILPQVYGQVRSITNSLRVLNSKFLAPLYRYNRFDNLCLKLLKWLHDQHSQSQNCAFAVSHGEFAINSLRQHNVLLYSLPSSSRQDIFHLPLFFHEFGHNLYACHSSEMEALSRAVQMKLQDQLGTPFQENNAKYQKDLERSSAIIETWYSWVEELFCDAVGLCIGGASFLHTFSLYLRTDGNAAFYRPEEKLAMSSHPVSWLRVKFLAQRAKTLGLEKEAEALESDWKNLAKLLGERENYHGYYRESYNPFIMAALDDMLIEASPINFADFDRSVDTFSPEQHNFIELTNWAWRTYFKDQKHYKQAELQVVEFYNNTLQ